MKIYEILNGSNRADIYHGTSIDNAMEILSSNMFYASTKSTSEAQVSFSRVLGQAVRFASWIDPAGVVFVIDQEQLKNQVGRKMQPLDHTGGDGREYGAEDKEEAVYTDIKNASSLIKKILVFARDDLDTDRYALILNDPRTKILQHSDYEYKDNMSRKQFNRTQ
jgi:hypothetical protein